MAKIQVIGNAVVFSSAMKLEDLELVKKYQPEALSRKDEEGEILFVVTTTDYGCGDVTDDCVVFANAALDGSGVATVTKLLPDGITGESVKELLADKLGKALMFMNQMEEYLPEVVEHVTCERQNIMNAIEFQ